MKYLSQSLVLLGGLVTNIVAGPVVDARPRPAAIMATRVTDLKIREGIDERALLPTMTIGKYSLATSVANKKLFTYTPPGVSGSGVSVKASLEVTCKTCWTKGTALVTTSGATKKDDLLDILHPIDSIVAAIGLLIKVDFQDVSGYFDLSITAKEKITYAYPLFTSQTSVGYAVSEDISVGLVVIVDLVFTVGAEVDLGAGFTIAFPKGAYIIVDPLGGDIVESSFPNAQMGHIPITVTSGSASFNAALRVRIQAGTTVEVFGFGVDFELGVFATVIEYKASLASTAQCALQFTHLLDTNIGAFAEAVAVIDYKSFGASPTKAITLVTQTLPGTCITKGSSKTTSKATTTASIKTSVLPNSPISVTSTKASGNTGTTSTASYSGENHSRAGAPTASAKVTSTAKATTSSSHANSSSAALPISSSYSSSSSSDGEDEDEVPIPTIIQILTPDTLATPIVSTVFTATYAKPTYNVTTTPAVYTPAFPQWNATGVYTTMYVGPNSIPVVVGQASDAPGVTATSNVSPAPSNSVGPVIAAATTTKASNGNLAMGNHLFVAAVAGLLSVVATL